MNKKILVLYTASRFGSSGTAATYYVVRKLSEFADVLIFEPSRISDVITYDRSKFNIFNYELNSKGSVDIAMLAQTVAKQA